ncbi:MAG: hypothetical protein ACOC23_09155 [Thermodesulfobacteriota bacterium]
MGKGQKLLDRWADNLPREARRQEVITFLDTYFPHMWTQNKSSHIVVRCDALKGFPGYQPYGEISVPIKGGQKVKGFYVKRLIKAVALLLELGEES